MAFGNGPSIVTNGLVLALDAADRNSYPGSGTTWSDLSGRNTNSTLINGPTFSSANGGAIVFDGTNDYSTTVAGQAFFQYTNQITVSWWVRRNGNIVSGAGGGQCTFNSDNMSTNVWLMHGIDDNTMRFYVNNSGTFTFSTTGTLLINTWYNLVGNADSSAVRMYVNGVLSNSSTGISGTIVNNANSIIGWGIDPRFATGGRFFNGSIANAAVYNRTLSASEILQNYNATKGRFSL